MDIHVIRFADTDSTIFESTYGFLSRLLTAHAPNAQLRYFVDDESDERTCEFRVSSYDELIDTEFSDLIDFTVRALGAREFRSETLWDKHRYEVRDQNGDVLDETDIYGHATHYFRNWVVPSDETLEGSGIFNNVSGRWEFRMRFDSED